MFIFLAILIDFDTIIDIISWGIDTITTPFIGIDCITVSGTSPVPGGISIIK